LLRYKFIHHDKEGDPFVILLEKIEWIEFQSIWEYRDVNSTNCVYIPESYPCRCGIVMLNRPTVTRVKVQFSQAKLYIVASSSFFFFFFFFPSQKIFTTL
jgi:hypothetical protein